MKGNQIAALRERYAELGRMRDALKAASPDEAQGLDEVERLIANVGRLIAEHADKPRRVAPARAAAEHVVVVGRIRKTDHAEFRVSVAAWKSRRTVDLRLWFMPDGQDEMVPSRKGVTLDASKIDQVLEALMLARQHLPADIGATG